ncbi:NAD-dependent epimerase/dehydratase family protein [Myxococcota bacterium]|nr:NAD-dependent epimerase/dehydratase family protein [Myxococcota bacterium]MCZ7618497.1 NAD-dependent epimerase/dehydratase family protein [Myxococcota bacterium]
MSRPERILVTGAAGFVGSTLVERLLADGRTVVGLDNFDPFYPEALKRENLVAASGSSRFRLETGDIRDSAAVARALDGVDAVVHLAALAGVRPSLERPAEYADVNVRGTAVVAEAMVRARIGRLVFASSSSVYGEREQASGPFRERDPVERPVSPYAATKRAGELLLHSFHHAEGLAVTCARIFTAYGPRQRPDLAIRKFAERMRAGQTIPVYGDGTATRDFTYVEDLVDGLVRALDAGLGFAILNFGAGRTVKLLDVIAELERALGVPARIEWLPRQMGDVSRTWADTSASAEALGWVPKVALEEGVSRFCAWLAGRRD